MQIKRRKNKCWMIIKNSYNYKMKNLDILIVEKKLIKNV